MYEMLNQVRAFLTNPGNDIRTLSKKVQQAFRSENARNILVRTQNFALLLEAINFSGKNTRIDYSNMNDTDAHPDFAVPIVYACIMNGRPCMLAEVLKRGANPNIYIPSRTTYLSIAAMHGIYRWSIRLLLLDGANFDLPNSKGKTAKILGETEPAIAGFCRHVYNNEFYHRQFGPTWQCPNPLPTQILSHLMHQSLSQYLEELTVEISHLNRLKQQADKAFKLDEFKQAAQLYDQAGQWMERFAGDHEELTLCYLERALGYYQNAMMCYEQHYGKIETNIEHPLVDFLATKLKHIDNSLALNPHFKPITVFKSPLPPPRNAIQIKSNPEELKTMQDSRIWQSIQQYRQTFSHKLGKYQQLVQTQSSTMATHSKSRYRGLEGSDERSLHISSSTEPLSSSDSVRTSWLPRQKKEKSN